MISSAEHCNEIWNQCHAYLLIFQEERENSSGMYVLPLNANPCMKIYPVHNGSSVWKLWYLPTYSFRYVVLMRLPLSLGSFKISVRRKMQLRQLLLLLRCLSLDRYSYYRSVYALLTCRVGVCVICLCTCRDDIWTSDGYECHTSTNSIHVGLILSLIAFAPMLSLILKHPVFLYKPSPLHIQCSLALFTLVRWISLVFEFSFLYGIPWKCRRFAGHIIRHSE